MDSVDPSRAARKKVPSSPERRGARFRFVAGVLFFDAERVSRALSEPRPPERGSISTLKNRSLPVSRFFAFSRHILPIFHAGAVVLLRETLPFRVSSGSPG